MVTLFIKIQVFATKVIPFISVAQKSQVYCFKIYLLIVKGVVWQEIILPFWNGFIPKVGTWEYCKNYCIPENFILFVAMQCNKYNAEEKTIASQKISYYLLPCSATNIMQRFCSVIYIIYCRQYNQMSCIVQGEWPTCFLWILWHCLDCPATAFWLYVCMASNLLLWD